MRSEIASRILNNIPLETKVKVSNEMFAINLITELGYRENKMWKDSDPEDNRILELLIKLCKSHTDSLMKEINKHRK